MHDQQLILAHAATVCFGTIGQRMSLSIESSNLPNAGHDIRQLEGLGRGFGDPSFFVSLFPWNMMAEISSRLEVLVFVYRVGGETLLALVFEAICLVHWGHR